jgi:GrpB-like predicted nucleotidyltransferase (UPF0157 family)/predicted TPR repeat methyltransferase
MRTPRAECRDAGACFGGVSMIDRMDDPKRIVARGYDRIAERYAAWTGETWQGDRAHFGELLFERLPPGAAVLDLGCGTGVPVARALATRFAVTGVDLSPRSIALARRNVPAATFLQADMSALDFPAESFDAVVAFYSIIHLPRDEHLALLRAIASWLRPGGLFIAALGAGESDDWYEDDWLGAPMYWSHFDGAANIRLVEATGLRLLRAEDTTKDEDGVPATFLWVAAEKPAKIGLTRGLVRLAPHHPGWARLFAEEASRVRNALGDAALRIEHVGSTAVAGIPAKPILDIIAAVADVGDAADAVRRLEAIGYELIPEDPVVDRVFLVKGSPDARQIHLSLAEPASACWRDHVLFRDCLRAQPRTAAAYAVLKAQLAARYPADRTAYTAGKAAFIQEVIAAAARGEVWADG